MGYENTIRIQYKRSTLFFLVALCQMHQWEPRWHHSSICLPWSFEYYRTLRKAIKENPDLKRLLRRCRHCRIRFLTLPCNQGRKDLGCPMGCAKAYRDQETRKRSQSYYQSPEGRIKKRELNRNRSKLKKDTSDSSEPKSYPKIIAYLCFIAQWVGKESISFSAMNKRYRWFLGQMRQHSLGMDEKICEIPDG